MHVTLFQTDSLCIVLLNLVDPSEVNAELEAEVKEEAEGFGSVAGVIGVVTEKKEARVFVTFFEKKAAARARLALDRRFFGGRVISAKFYDLKNLEEGKFSEQIL